MTIEPYNVVVTRMTNTLADQIRANRRNHSYPESKRYSGLVERRYKLEPNNTALELLDDSPSVEGTAVLKRTHLCIVEEESGNAAKSVIPCFTNTCLWRNVSWDIEKLQASINAPSEEVRLMSMDGLLRDTTAMAMTQIGPAIAVELFKDCPNILKYDARVALVIDLTGILPVDAEIDRSTLDRIASYLHGTGLDIDLDSDKVEDGPKKYMAYEEWSKAGVDSITKYTIGVTVSFDDSDLNAHELCIDIFADDVNFAIKKAVKLLHSYCRDNVQVVRTRVIREKRYIAQDTDTKEDLS